MAAENNCLTETSSAELLIIDLSGKKIKKLNKPTPLETQAATLILDDNELQRLDNIDSYFKVEKLSAVRNQLLRMYGVCRLHNIHTLILAHNKILTIEGLKELVHLRCLNLAGNDIKTIDHLNTNVNLEHLDLSENSITHISDVSFLKNLKDLLLHSNKIGHLKQCDRFLPPSLVTLTLADNNVADLNEISQLVTLTGLHSISLANNPCVVMTGNKVGFDYRPFVINWVTTVQVIDGYVVDAIESLKGEWLYSQGRGRHFRVGDHQELSQYLASVCPLSGEALETEEDRKLRLILSKAQHHQQQLREQGNSPILSPSARKKFQNSKHSPRMNSSRLSNRSKSPDKSISSMTASCYTNMNNGTDSGILMTQSLDPSILGQTVISNKSDIIGRSETSNGICLDAEPVNSPLQALSKLVPVPESLMSPDYRPSPLAGRLTAPPMIPNKTSTPSRMSQPVKSPKMTRSNIAKPLTSLQVDNKRRNSPSPIRNRRSAPPSTTKIATPPPHHKPLVSAMKKSPSTEDESEICDAKLHTIQMKVEEKRLQKDAEISSSSSGGADEKAEMAAIFIQKMWRGFYTRNKDKQVQDAYKTIQAQRADEYIQKLATDMESTKAALESERKIQMLQMQAINALWKKVSALQPDGAEPSTSAGGGTNGASGSTSVATSMDPAKFDSTNIVNLTQTCSSLQNQVQQLQGSMQDILRFMTMFAQQAAAQPGGKENAAGTQTEIVAVHTPQGEGAKTFPFQRQARPSSLPLPVGSKTPKREPLVTSTATATDSTDVRHFADNLVDGVMRTVSESKTDSFSGSQEEPPSPGDVVRASESLVND